MVCLGKIKNTGRLKFFCVIMLFAAAYFSLIIISLIDLFTNNEGIWSQDMSNVLVTAIMVFAAYLYIRSYPLVKNGGISPKTIIIMAVFIGVLAMSVWPFITTDIFSYINRSRVFTVYGANPYITPYDNFPHDVLYSALSNMWSKNTTVYGPLFNYISFGLTFLGGDSLFLSVLFFKLICVASFIASAWLIYRVSESVEAMYLFAFNPFLIFELVINSHNDILMIFLFLLALFYLFKKNETRSLLLSWLFLSLSVFIKYFTLLFAPFFFIFILKKLRKNKRSLFFALMPILFVVMTWFFFLPFWRGGAIFNRVAYLVSLESSYWVSPLIVILSRIFSWLNINDVDLTARNFSRAFFVLFFLFLCFIIFYRLILNKKKKAPGKKFIVNSFFLIFALFLGTFFTWLVPQYYTTFVVLAIVCWGLSGRNEYRDLAFLVSLYGIIISFIIRNGIHDLCRQIILYK